MENLELYAIWTISSLWHGHSKASVLPQRRKVPFTDEHISSLYSSILMSALFSNLLPLNLHTSFGNKS